MGKFAYETRNRALYTPRNPESFSHDLDGNLLNDGTWVYTWDAENRLIGMENTNDYYVATGKKQKLAFAYDETGRRVEKKVWSWDSGAWALVTHHRFLYDGWNMIAQLDGNNGNGVLKAFTWGNDISGSMDGAGGVGGLLDVQDYGIGGCSFYMYDGNGNVAGLTGCYGGFDAEYAYDPYGGTLYDNPIYDGVTKDNPFRFSTKYLDFETGLYYYGYRYYNPDQGRWISRDPIEEEGGLNLYAFVGNEPVGKWDRLGLEVTKSEGIWQGVKEWFGIGIKDCWDLEKNDCRCMETAEIDGLDGMGMDIILSLLEEKLNPVSFVSLATDSTIRSATIRIRYRDAVKGKLETCESVVKYSVAGGEGIFSNFEEMFREARRQFKKLDDGKFKNKRCD